MLTIIVEGLSEEYALPVLIEMAVKTKLLSDLSEIEYLVANGKPYILQQSDDGSQGLEGFIRRQIAATNCKKFVVLLDSDRTFPPYLTLNNDDRDLALEYQRMPIHAHRIAEKYGVEVVVCWAKWELESWLIGGLRRGGIKCDENLGQFSIHFIIPEDTSEKPREAKAWLLRQFSKRKEENYTPSVVECLALHVNIYEAQRRNPTLMEFFDVLRRIVVTPTTD